MLPQLVRDNLYLQSGKYVHAGTSLQGRGAAPLFLCSSFGICHGVMGKDSFRHGVGSDMGAFLSPHWTASHRRQPR